MKQLRQSFIDKWGLRPFNVYGPIPGVYVYPDTIDGNSVTIYDADARFDPIYAPLDYDYTICFTPVNGQGIKYGVAVKEHEISYTHPTEIFRELLNKAKAISIKPTQQP